MNRGMHWRLRAFVVVLVALGLSAALTGPARAQQTAKVVAGCGSASYTAGTTNYQTVDTTGNACGSGSASGNTPTQLLASASSTGAAKTIAGGSYIWSSSGTFGGTTLNLQWLSEDATTWVTLVSATVADSPVAVNIGQGTSVRVQVVGGTPSALNSYLRGY